MKQFSLPVWIPGLLAIGLCLHPQVGAADAELFSPNWSIVIDDFSYSDLAFDQRPGFEGREYLSGEWAAAVSYTVDSTQTGPLWLNPEFLFPDWTANSDFVVEKSVSKLPGTNAWGFPTYRSTIANASLRITITSEMVDTTNGVLQSMSPRSAVAGDHVMSDRYVLRQSFGVSNISAKVLTGVKFFKFLHSLQAEKALYDDRNYGGAFNGHRYTVSEQGIDVEYGSDLEGDVLHFDVVGLHANLTPAAWEVGRYGNETVDSHVLGKPGVGVHLSVEADSLSDLDFFAPSNRWVSGAVRCDLGTFVPNASTNLEFLMTLGTTTVAKPVEVKGWGDNSSGQVGSIAATSNLVAVAAGGAHNLLLNRKGEVIGWGSNSHGQSTVPPGLGRVDAIAAGGAHSLVLLNDGSLVAWGNNTSGQTNVPQELFEYYDKIAAGNAHNLALRYEGTVLAWGSNSSGQTNVPASATNVWKIAAGNAHSLALREDGTVVAWGDNSAGQLNIPGDLADVWDIAAGGRHNLALLYDGTVVGWGDNTYGQAQPPDDLYDVAAIAAGESHSVALTYSGEVIAWGRNSFGQATVPATLPRPLGIAAGGNHTIAVVPMSPVLQIGKSGTNLVLSCSAVWAPDHSGGYFEQTTSLTNSSWVPSVGVSTTDRLQYQFKVPLPTKDAYFRMRLP